MNASPNIQVYFIYIFVLEDQAGVGIHENVSQVEKQL